MTNNPLTRITAPAARWAMAQAGICEMTIVLAYAEACALIAGGLRVVIEPPERLARRVVDATVSGDKPWRPEAHTFPVHLCQTIRLETAATIAQHARLRGRAPTLWAARLSDAQLGDLLGVERLAHWAGEMMASIRNGDAVVIEAAIKLADFVRGRLEPWAGDPDEEDTATALIAPVRRDDDNEAN